MLVFGFDGLVKGFELQSSYLNCGTMKSVTSFALIAWFSQFMVLLLFYHHILNWRN